MLSVIIPNRNGAATIDHCLKALIASDQCDFEVIVVDDASSDDSVERIKHHPCRLIRLKQHAGASRARNTGALHSRGELLFFIDADCLVNPDTLQLAEKLGRELGPRVIIGGTYTPIPADPVFFSTFQSIYINYCETKHPQNPDYVASHAQLIHADTFRQSGGFPEDFMPILEDVEYSHRLRRLGYKLIMAPELVVRHQFNFTLPRSLANARRKSHYWLCYSLQHRDLLADSGTASLELKVNVSAFALSLILLLAGLVSGNLALLLLLLPVQIFNGLVQRRLLAAFRRAGGYPFALGAASYYAALYPAAIILGGLGGLKTFWRQRRRG